jgi:hypothetical protein
VKVRLLPAKTLKRYIVSGPGRVDMPSGSLQTEAMNLLSSFFPTVVPVTS